MSTKKPTKNLPLNQSALFLDKKSISKSDRDERARLLEETIRSLKVAVDSLEDICKSLEESDNDTIRIGGQIDDLRSLLSSVVQLAV